MADKEIINILQKGGVGILPTDTLYGLVGSAQNKKTVERIYKLRKRRPDKPLIILISSIKDLALFSVVLDSYSTQILQKLWPGKVSVVLPCPLVKFTYLHRGTKTLAFRLPKSPKLVAILKKTGPLVAPSANLEGSPPALTVKEAYSYFGNGADFYVNVGKKQSPPSTLISITNKKIEILRAGARKV